MRYTRDVLLTLAALLAATMPRAASADFYTVTDLGALPGGSGASTGQGLNAAGAAAGEGDTAGAFHAFRSAGGTPTDLGTLAGGTSSTATGIDGSGRVVGYGDVLDSNNQMVFRAFRSSGNTLVNFGVNGITDASGQGATNSFGLAISGGGTVVGYATFPDGSRQAFTADAPDALKGLGTLGGRNSMALGVSNSGIVVGQADTASGFTHGFIMGPAGLTDLGLLAGGTRSAAYGANNSGTAVGSADSFGSTLAVFAPAGGTFQPLGGFAGGSGSANAINDLGAIVGSASGSGSSLAIYYANTAALPIDLNSRITDPTWTLTSAVAINDAGQIVGTGTHLVDGVAETRGYLLTPSAVPEPPAALLAALGGAATAALLKLRRG